MFSGWSVTMFSFSKQNYSEKHLLEWRVHEIVFVLPVSYLCEILGKSFNFSTSLFLNFPKLKVMGLAGWSSTCHVPMLWCRWCPLVAMWSEPERHLGGHSRRGKQQSHKTWACLVHLRKSKESRVTGMSERKNKKWDQREKLRPDHAGPWKLLYVGF